MPRALKIHWRHGCRSEVHRTFWNGSARVTGQLELVTCVQCKNIIAKHELHDLRDRSEFPAVPTFDVRPSAETYRLRVRDESGRRLVECHLTFRCPVCLKVNHHGGIIGQRGACGGHRSSHCPCWRDGYFIREIAEEALG